LWIITVMLDDLRGLQVRLQAQKRESWKRRVSFGDLITDRWQNAIDCGFGEGSSMYDNVLVIGDVTVGKNVWIGPNVILDGSGGLVIGDYVAISAGVQIYTHHTVRWALSGGEEGPERRPTRIGSRIFIGPNTIIQMGVTIGDEVVIGAMSFVNRDIPSGSRVWGCPAKGLAFRPSHCAST
jgi:acetyltransferase-like isoleucine patch superfamily enzyme